METETSRRVSKREFISRVAVRSALPIKTVSRAYESVLEELTNTVRMGDVVVLTGFGRFYRQDHKGHKVRFGRRDIEDYPVLKFSASPRMNKNMGDGDEMLDGITEHEREYALA